MPAVGKCLSIIRLLDAEPGAGLGLAAIAGRLGLTKSHCLMILRTLVAEGWLSHDAARQRYALAPSLLLDRRRPSGGTTAGRWCRMCWRGWRRASACPACCAG
ncbi:helix-turn-helix domain-containing protein [Teichococcus aestuarii]|uniref:helix-turn-helix domain-containing protein n=1 Tax=Teichococcus aestuarii TaxID=568898 RepID=UPI003607166F